MIATEDAAVLQKILKGTTESIQQEESITTKGINLFVAVLLSFGFYSARCPSSTRCFDSIH